MIRDKNVVAQIVQEWATIRSLVHWSRSYIGSGGVFINETPPDEFYNLPLVLAYSTLDDVLGQFINEGSFPCRKPGCFKLGEKMESAKHAIKWLNYALVNQGRDARNGLAHRNTLVAKNDCLRYIEAVGAELKGWGLIS
jgi:hypothetical protein